MKVTYKVTDRDYIDFYEFNAKNTKDGKRAMMTQIISVPVILAIVFLATAIMGAGKLLLIVQFLGYALFSYMWKKQQERSVRENASNVIAKLRTKGMTPYSPSGSLEFKDDEITDQRAEGLRTHHYTDIAQVYESKGALYLYMKEKKRVILIPASALPEEAKKQELMELLKSKIPSENFIK